MELQFNELSMAPCADKYAANAKMKQFAETISVARQKGFRQIRSYHDTSQIVLSDNYSLFDWLNNKEVPVNFRQFLYGMIVIPFINEEDDKLEEQYIGANYYFEDKENGINKVACVGLAGAYLYETLSVSLTTHSVWDKVKLQIIVEKDNESFLENVLNISSKTAFDNAEIVEFIENIGNITLIETTLHPENKELHLAGTHHGNAERQALWDKLKYNPYVIQMRSTSGYGTGQFIRSMKKNGEIEIVLEQKYSVLLQTTGRNLRETKAIAEILDEKYS